MFAHVLLRECNNRVILFKGLLVCGSETGIYKIREPPQDLQILIKSLSQLSLTLQIANFCSRFGVCTVCRFDLPAKQK
jgi:hypothetical protein